jgi:NAD(P)-dependent dehydrogenase (short-subunit alcohol dehydrogenase family)
MKPNVILITGAGSGIGRLSAQSLAQAGHTVYASMRDIGGRNAGRAREMRAWAEAEGVRLIPLELDVLSQASADAAVATVVREQGRLDVLVQNAGHLVVGPAEAFSAEETMAVLDTNFVGAHRVGRAALPQMRAQESGLLLWISSTTTKGGFPPFLGPYGAAKAAMDSLAVSMSYEVARFGIETAIVVPGAFTHGTEHFPSAGKPNDTVRNAAYARYDGVMDQVGERLSALTPPEADPQAVADELVRIVGLPQGQRPFRAVVDFVGDGAREVLEVAEAVRIDFAHRIGIADLLAPRMQPDPPTV